MTSSVPDARQIKPSWLVTFKVYLDPPTVRMLLLGFSAGLPLLLVLGTLSFWLREAGIDRTTIGYLSWVGLAYVVKGVWAPLVDRLPMVWCALDAVRIEPFGHGADAAGRSSRRGNP